LRIDLECLTGCGGLPCPPNGRNGIVRRFSPLLEHDSPPIKVIIDEKAAVFNGRNLLFKEN
jgi:hypothetical protein